MAGEAPIGVPELRLLNSHVASVGVGCGCQGSTSEWTPSPTGGRDEVTPSGTRNWPILLHPQPPLPERTKPSPLANLATLSVPRQHRRSASDTTDINTDNE